MTAHGERREALRYLLLLLPALAVLAILFVYPLLGIVDRSVYKGGYTLAAYRQVFGVPVYLQVLVATLKSRLQVLPLGVIVLPVTFVCSVKVARLPPE